MLKNGKWANHHDCCVRCGRTKFKHRRHGVCLSCTNIVFRKEAMRKYVDRTRYGGNRSIRLSINNICEVCCNRADLVVHHIDGNKNNNALTNLSTLCRGCHSGIHNLYRLRKKYSGYKHLLK